LVLSAWEQRAPHPTPNKVAELLKRTPPEDPRFLQPFSCATATGNVQFHFHAWKPAHGGMLVEVLKQTLPEDDLRNQAGLFAEELQRRKEKDAEEGRQQDLVCTILCSTMGGDTCLP
jgi:hypothetical protein